MMEPAGRRAARAVRGFQLTLVLAAIVGLITGLGVAAFDYVVSHLLERVTNLPAYWWAIVPSAGLITVVAMTRLWGDGDTATTDAYVRSYHQRGGEMSLRDLGPKLVGSALTIGSGNAFGFEGPSMLIGGTIGSATDKMLGERFRRDDAKVLMVAGAAAGVAAVFKAPLTGVIFALEVPYRSDMARRALLPSLVAAGSAYLTYVTLIGTEPLLATGGTAPFDLRDLAGGVLLGLVCGVLARLGGWAMEHGKSLSLSIWWRLTIALVALGGLAPLAWWTLGVPMHLGPSYEAIEWAADPSRAVPVLVGLLAMRSLATWVGVVGGGMGGLFIPLVTEGSIVGSIFQRIAQSPNERLFPTIGVAAFLGAGYRTPLAGVAFVAEATGEPGFLVPALLAAATAQLIMGRQSFSSYQRRERSPDTAPLRATPISEIMSPNVDAVNAESPVNRALDMMLAHDRRWAPVVEDGRYIGLLSSSLISEIEAHERTGRTAGEVALRDVLPVGPEEAVASVARRFRSSNLRAIAVVEQEKVVGVVTLRDLASLEILLDRLSDDSTGGV